MQHCHPQCNCVQNMLKTMHSYENAKVMRNKGGSSARLHEFWRLRTSEWIKQQHAQGFQQPIQAARFAKTAAARERCAFNFRIQVQIGKLSGVRGMFLFFPLSRVAQDQWGSLFLPTARNRPSVFAFFCVLVLCGHCAHILLRCIRRIFLNLFRSTHIMLRQTRLLYFGVYTSCYARHVFCTSVDTLHVKLGTSSVLQWIHFMLSQTRLLYFGRHWTHFMLRQMLLLYFLGPTSCYVRHLF